MPLLNVKLVIVDVFQGARVAPVDAALNVHNPDPIVIVLVFVLLDRNLNAVTL